MRNVLMILFVFVIWTIMSGYRIITGFETELVDVLKSVEQSKSEVASKPVEPKPVEPSKPEEEPKPEDVSKPEEHKLVEEPKQVNVSKSVSEKKLSEEEQLGDLLTKMRSIMPEDELKRFKEEIIEYIKKNRNYFDLIKEKIINGMTNINITKPLISLLNTFITFDKIDRGGGVIEENKSLQNKLEIINKLDKTGDLIEKIKLTKYTSETNKLLDKSVNLYIYYNIGIIKISDIKEKPYLSDFIKKYIEYIEKNINSKIFEDSKKIEIGNQQKIITHIIETYKEDENKWIKNESTMEKTALESKDVSTYTEGEYKFDILEDQKYQLSDDDNRKYKVVNVYKNKRYIVSIIYYTSLSEGYTFRYFVPNYKNTVVFGTQILNKYDNKEKQDNIEEYGNIEKYLPDDMDGGGIVKSPIDYVGVNIINTNLMKQIMSNNSKNTNNVKNDIYKFINQEEMKSYFCLDKNKEENVKSCVNLNFLIMFQPRLYNNLLLETIRQNTLLPVPESEKGGYFDTNKNIDDEIKFNCSINETNILLSENFEIIDNTLKKNLSYDYSMPFIKNNSRADIIIHINILKIEIKEKTTGIIYNLYLKYYNINFFSEDQKELEIPVNINITSDYYINVHDVVPKEGDKINVFGMSDLYISSRSAWFYKIFEYRDQLWKFMWNDKNNYIINGNYVFIGDIYQKIWPCYLSELRTNIEKLIK